MQKVRAQTLANIRWGLNSLERSVEALDIVTELVDSSRVAFAYQGERPQIMMRGTAHSLGHGEDAQSTLQGVHDFINRQGKDPLAIYHLDEIGVRGEGSPTIIVANKWMDVYEFHRQYSR